MLDLGKIKAITLDLDDTLWPIWPTIERAEKALHDWLSEHAPMTCALFATATGGTHAAYACLACFAFTLVLQRFIPAS